MEINNFIKPSETTYTIYGKSGCSYCGSIKKILESEYPEIVNCDDYLVNSREDFLKFIKELAGVEHKTFPIIFHKSKFVGGFTETKLYYDKEKAFSDF
jgi:glutaredoxin